MCLASILSVGCGSISEENKPNERYENVKKEDLTYDTEKDDSKDNEKEVITNFHDGMCVLKWQDYFADGVCRLGDPGDDYCLDTYDETVDYFWS